MIFKSFITLLAIYCASGFIVLYADSPITSTFFYKAYTDLEIVNRANRKGSIDREIAAYLLSKDNTIDKKAAVINALSWKFEGKDNALIFKLLLAVQYRKNLDELALETLHGDELLCLGYLTVMDDYFQPQHAIPILEMAKKKHPQSYTVNMILALARAQMAMEYDWCLVWQHAEAVRINSELRRDLRQEADIIIFDYMNLYREYCD